MTKIYINGEFVTSVEAAHVESYINELEFSHDSVEVSEWNDEGVQIEVSDEKITDGMIHMKTRHFCENYGENFSIGTEVMIDGFEYQITDNYGDDVTLMPTGN